MKISKNLTIYLFGLAGVISLYIFGSMVHYSELFGGFFLYIGLIFLWAGAFLWFLDD